MVTYNGKIQLIDLDAAALGPLHYDFASWRLRQELFDRKTDVEAVVSSARRSELWDEDMYRAMIGWKALSSLTYVLNYAEANDIKRRTNEIGSAASRLGVFVWQGI
jgi:hypothetical protein